MMEFKILLLKFGIITMLLVQTVFLKGFILEPTLTAWEDASGVCGTTGHILVPGRRYRAKALRRVLTDGQSVWLNGWRTTSETSPDSSGRVRSLKIDFSRAHSKEVKIVCQMESIFYDPLHSAVTIEAARDICTSDRATLADVLTESAMHEISNSIGTDTPYWVNSISPQGSNIKQCLFATRMGDDLKYAYDDCAAERTFICMRDDVLISTFAPVISLKMTRFEEFRKLIEEYEAAMASSSDTILQTPSTQISIEPSPTTSSAQITFTETAVQTLSSETPVQTLASETPVQTLASETPVETLLSETPVETLASETPVETLVSETPLHTLASETPVQTLSSETPAETVASETPIQTLASETPVETLSSETPLQTYSAETSSESLTTVDSLNATTELSSAYTAQATNGFSVDTVLSTTESFLIPISATSEEEIQFTTSQITQSATVDVIFPSRSMISSESHSQSDSSNFHQFKQYSFVSHSDYYKISEIDDTDYMTSISHSFEPTSTISTTTSSVSPTLEPMPTIPFETTSLSQSDYEFHYQTTEIDDSLYTQSTESLLLGEPLLNSSAFSNVLQSTEITASPSYEQIESSAVLTDDRSIIFESLSYSMHLLPSSVYAYISSDVSTTSTATHISGSVTTVIIMASEELEFPSSSYVDTVMYESPVSSSPTSAPTLGTSESSITSPSYECMVKDYLTFCPGTTSVTDLQTSSSMPYEVHTMIRSSYGIYEDIESVKPDMPIKITPTLHISSTIQVDYDDADDDYEVDDNITSSTISDTITPIYTIDTSDSTMEIGTTTDKIDKEIKGGLDKDGMDDDEEGNESSDTQGGIVKQKKEEPKGGEEAGLWVAFGILIILVSVSLILAFILYRRRNRQRSKDISPVNGAATSGETVELRDSRSPSRENGKPRESTTFKNHAYDV